MSKKTIVADASPLIAFGRMNQLTLLSDTLGKIIIPEVIAQECLIDISKPGAKEIQKAISKKTITIHQNTDPQKNKILFDILDQGEATAIALALHLKTGLLIDEKLGRAYAKKLHLKIIGTAGVLLLAKQKKLINKISPLLYKLKESGYFLSKELMHDVLKRAKENIVKK